MLHRLGRVLCTICSQRGALFAVRSCASALQDITQIREITGEQERIADDLSRLIETANAPIFGVDLQGMVTEWNRKARVVARGPRVVFARASYIMCAWGSRRSLSFPAFPPGLPLTTLSVISFAHCCSFSELVTALHKSSSLPYSPFMLLRQREASFVAPATGTS